MEPNAIVSTSPQATLITNLITAGVWVQQKVFIVSLRVFLQPRNGDSLSVRSRGADDLLNIKSLNVQTSRGPFWKHIMFSEEKFISKMDTKKECLKYSLVIREGVILFCLFSSLLLLR